MSIYDYLWDCALVLIFFKISSQSTNHEYFFAFQRPLYTQNAIQFHSIVKPQFISSSSCRSSYHHRLAAPSLNAFTGAARC